MYRIAELREARRLSVKDLAAMIGTTQKMIKSWEEGTADPTNTQLREMALIFNTGVRDIQASNPLSDVVITQNLHLLAKTTGEDGFWGNLGLLLPDQQSTRWYAITGSQYASIQHQISNEDEGPWTSTLTLDNKLVIFDQTKVKRIWLLDEACDAVSDWDRENGAGTIGFSQETFSGLENWFNHVEDYDSAAWEDLPERYRTVIENVIRDHDLSPEDVEKMISVSRVYLKDGTVEDIELTPDNMMTLQYALEARDFPRLVALDNINGNFESYIPAAEIVAIELPLNQLMDAMDEDNDSNW